MIRFKLCLVDHKVQKKEDIHNWTSSKAIVLNEVVKPYLCFAGAFGAATGAVFAASTGLVASAFFTSAFLVAFTL